MLSTGIFDLVIVYKPFEIAENDALIEAWVTIRRYIDTQHPRPIHVRP